MYPQQLAEAALAAALAADTKGLLAATGCRRDSRLVLTVGLCLFVLVPTSLIFAVDGPQVYEALYEHADDPAEVHRQLAYWLQSFHAANAPKIELRRARFRDAAVGLGAQIVLLSVALGVS